MGDVDVGCCDILGVGILFGEARDIAASATTANEGETDTFIGSSNLGGGEGSRNKAATLHRKILSASGG